jgi:hypothetical protein
MMPQGVARRRWILIVIGLVLVLAGCKTGGGAATETARDAITQSRSAQSAPIRRL